MDVGIIENFRKSEVCLNIINEYMLYQIGIALLLSFAASWVSFGLEEMLEK